MSHAVLAVVQNPVILTQIYQESCVVKTVIKKQALVLYPIFGIITQNCTFFSIDSDIQNQSTASLVSTTDYENCLCPEMQKTLIETFGAAGSIQMGYSVNFDDRKLSVGKTVHLCELSGMQHINLI